MIVVLRGGSDEVAFVPLDAGPKIVISQDQTSTASTAELTSIRGDRAYVAVAKDNDVQIGAIDLAKGVKLWDLRAVGVRAGQWTDLTAVAGGLVLRGEASSGEPGRLVVLDPDTGERRWDREVEDSDTVVFSQETLVLSSEKAHVTLGLDWTRGTQRWSEPDPTSSTGSETVTSVLAVEPADLAGPSWFGATLASPDAPQGRSLLQLTSGRQLIVRDPATGRQRRTLRSVGDGYGTKYLAYDGKFYSAGSGEAYRIDEFDTVKGGTQVTVYQAQDDHSPTAMAPCGEKRICVLETVGGTSQNLVVIDVAKRAELWHTAVKDATTVIPVGEHILVTDGSDQSWLFDATGTLVLDEDHRNDTIGVRISSGSALLFSGTSIGASVGELSLTGLGVVKGTRTPLGTIKVAAKSCSWSRTHLVCAAETEFRSWRFAT